MITIHKLQTDEKLREMLPDGFEKFPCYCKYNSPGMHEGGVVPWHWHQAFEIDYVLKGRAHFRTTETDAFLRPGDAVFINSNMLHMMDLEKEETEFYTFFFDPELLTGGFGTIFNEKYVLPVLSSQKLQAHLIHPADPEGLRMLNILMGVMDSFRKEAPGYEFEIRSDMCRLWMILLGATEDTRGEDNQASRLDHERIKQMISYVEDHYGDRVTLAEIAGAAQVSSRECGRCFSKTLGISPIEYLTRYRIRQAAKKITETAEPIGKISMDCGFSSDSYFGKQFHEMMGCSPREYRKSWKEP